MTLPSTDTVIVNWKRPENIAPIIQAIRGQSVPSRLILIDAGGKLDTTVIQSADVYIRMSTNFGPWNRYALSLVSPNEYTYFADDDMVPGARCLENFLKYKDLPFAVLGQIGRRFTNDEYRSGDVIAKDQPEIVDSVVRGYFVISANLRHLLTWRSYVEPEDFGDDLWLCHSLAILGNLNCYCIPAANEERMNIRELPDHDATWRQAGWIKRRTRVLQRIRILLEGVQRS